VPLTGVNPYDGVHGGMSALPNTACTTNASLLTSGTSTDQLSVLSGLIKVQQGTSAGQLDTTSGQVKVQAGTGNGQIDLVGGIPGGLRTATAAGGSASTITLDGAANANNSFYNDCLIQITGGTGGSQSRLITGYVGSTQVATVTPNWVTTPDTSSVFVILPAGRADIGAWLGTVVTAASAGVPDVNAKNINNVAATSVTTINANLGQTQPVNFTGTGGSALIKSDMQDIAGSAVSASTAQLGVNVVNIAGQGAALDGNNLLKVDVEDIKGTASTGAAGYSRSGPEKGVKFLVTRSDPSDLVFLPELPLESFFGVQFKFCSQRNPLALNVITKSVRDFLEFAVFLSIFTSRGFLFSRRHRSDFVPPFLRNDRISISSKSSLEFRGSP
jgi:hypothetical protein